MLKQFDVTQNLYLRHHMVVGVGDWGWKIIQRTSQAVQDTHPDLLPTIEYLFLNENAVHWINWINIPILANIEPDQPNLFNKKLSSYYPLDLNDFTGLINRALSMATAQEKLDLYQKSGFQFVSGDYPLIDIHIMGKVEDLLFQQVLLPFVKTLLSHSLAGYKFRIYLYLGADSTKWADLNRPENLTKKSNLINFREELDAFLISEINGETADAGLVGSCHIVDTVNEETRAIYTQIKSSNQIDRSIPLADMVAGYLALIVGSELPECQEIDTLSLAKLVHSNQLSKSMGYCSSFGLSSIVFPISAIKHSFILGLCRKVLARFMPSNSTDRDNASSLVTEFFVGHKIVRPRLTAHINEDDRTGQPHRFDFQPIALNLIPENDIVDRILSWDAMIEQNKFKPVIKSIAMKADGVVEDAKKWIGEKIDGLVMKAKPSTGDAVDFCERLKVRLEKERLSVNINATRETHWFSELFGRPVNPVKGHEINQQLLQTKLQVAIGKRVLRLATWQRFAVFAALESIFILAAWRFLGPTILEHLLPLFWDIPALVGMLLVLLAVLVGNCLGAFYVILASEMRIVHAQSNLIRAIQEKYRQRLQNLVEEIIQGVYQQLEAYLDQEIENIQKRTQIIFSLDKSISEQEKLTVNIFSLQHEKTIITTRDIQELVPELQNQEIDLLYAEFIKKQVDENWRKTNSGLFRRFLWILLNEKANQCMQGLSIEGFMDANPGRHPLKETVQELESRVKIQLNLSGFGTAYRLSFLAVDDEKISQAPKALEDPRKTVFITTLDKSRFSYLKTIHGLELKKLKLWENLK
jgi:hypothetical protein